MTQFKFYFNPETLDAYADASAKEQYDFIRYECDWDGEDDFEDLLADFKLQCEDYWLNETKCRNGKLMKDCNCC